MKKNVLLIIAGAAVGSYVAGYTGYVIGVLRTYREFVKTVEEESEKRRKKNPNLVDYRSA